MSSSKSILRKSRLVSGDNTDNVALPSMINNQQIAVSGELIDLQLN